MIRGDTLFGAVLSELPRICDDALPREGNWRPVSVAAEWRADVMRGRGGVEVVIRARRASDGAAGEYPLWIAAAPHDMRKAMSMDVTRARS